MIEILDQLHRPVRLPGIPVKIVSLVPSITETLFYLDLGESLRGVTNFCTEPAGKAEAIQKIGGTKNPDLAAIGRISPDLIIAAREENRKEDIDALSADYPVYVSDITTLDQAVELIEHIGNMCGREDASAKLMDDINAKFTNPVAGFRGFKVVYVMWNKPIMVAGTGTFINDMIIRTGHTNLGAELGSRYPSCEFEILRNLRPQFVILSSEPYHFREKDLERWKEELPLSRVILADATYFSWYGSRILGSADYISALLNSN